MDSTSIDQRTKRGEAVKVPSKSRPGLMHFVSPDGKNCSCEAGQYGAPDCSHRRDVRKDSRPYVIEERHDSRLPGSVWCVIQRFTGEVEGVYTSVGEAYWTLWALEERVA